MRCGCRRWLWFDPNRKGPIGADASNHVPPGFRNINESFNGLSTVAQPVQRFTAVATSLRDGRRAPAYTGAFFGGLRRRGDLTSLLQRETTTSNCRLVSIVQKTLLFGAQLENETLCRLPITASRSPTRRTHRASLHHTDLRRLLSQREHGSDDPDLGPADVPLIRKASVGPSKRSTVPPIRPSKDRGCRDLWQQERGAHHMEVLNSYDGDIYASHSRRCNSQYQIQR